MNLESEDERLAAVIGALMEDLRRDGRPDLDRAARDHPDLAAELRELWEAVTLTEDLARWASTEVERNDHGEATGFWSQEDHVPKAWSRVAGPQWGTPDQGDNNCELIREIGRGGMGVVYLARHVESGRLVAVKRMLGGDNARPEDLARFRQESRALARLVHPNILGLLHFGTHEGELYLVLPFVEGKTLAQRLATGPLPDTEAARILVDVARAVQHAHENDVLHRDLKPSNILIDGQGRPIVSDFGLAKVSRAGNSLDLTPSGAALGTPGYMAPEQARGVVGPSADVYGLGAILYHALTGRPPFQAATPLDTLLLVLEQEPVPPRILNPRVSPDLEMVTLKCLQKDPSQRYLTAGLLADDLQAFLNGLPVSARSTSLRGLAGRMLGETHLAPVLENWGALWMMHSVALLGFFGLTFWLRERGVSARWPYFAIFTVGLGAWASVFWALRRRGGPISFTERLLAHVWGAGVVSINLTFALEWLMGMPVLTLMPILAITNGMLYMIKGGILTGSFYLQAGAVVLTMLPMVWWPRFAPLTFAVVAGGCFFLTGLRAHRRRGASARLHAG